MMRDDDGLNERGMRTTYIRTERQKILGEVLLLYTVSMSAKGVTEICARRNEQKICPQGERKKENETYR